MDRGSWQATSIGSQKLGRYWARMRKPQVLGIWALWLAAFLHHGTLLAESRRGGPHSPSPHGDSPSGMSGAGRFRAKPLIYSHSPPAPGIYKLCDFEEEEYTVGQAWCQTSSADMTVSSRNAWCCVCSSSERHHAGGKDAYAPMAGRTDQLKYDTRAEVA